MFHCVSMFVHGIRNLPELHGHGVLPRCLGMTDKMWYKMVDADLNKKWGNYTNKLHKLRRYDGYFLGNDDGDVGTKARK